ncbi:MAG: glycosyltransferase [bacterium]|nr:glycosyltransferase [bacterium]
MDKTKILKKTFVIKEENLDEVIKLLTFNFNLPEVKSSLGMYSQYKDRILEVTFQNSYCYLMSHDRSSNIDKKYMELFNETPPIKIENRNIKFFLRIINNLGFTSAHISNEVTQLKYVSKDNKFSFILNVGTPIGNLLVINGDFSHSIPINLSKYLDMELISVDIDEKFTNIGTEKIFNDSRLLNSKIINYSNKYGIDIASSGVTSIKSLLGSKSNDYSSFELFYKKITGNYLNKEIQNKSRNKDHFKPISVIIPTYNSDESIVKCLYSIESQNLNNHQKKDIEVIIIDDGSNISVAKLLESHIENFSFNLKIIRIEKCSGISNARNLGAESSLYDHLLFIDSDILLSKNYILEHSIAQQLIPNGIFVSMKRNIEKDLLICELANITKGLNIPLEYDDKRITRVFKKGQSWINTVNLNGVYETLCDTDCFKNFGHGRIINGYDLPSMVVGHNMSISKKLLKLAGGFSEKFVGWGLEDTYFGARVICEGGFIIPLMTVGVYHINHPPRLGNEEQRNKEYKQNIRIYEELLNKEI